MIQTPSKKRKASKTPQRSVKVSRQSAVARAAAFGVSGYPGRSSKEHKYVDVASGNYNADTTGTVTLLNGVAQGDDNNQRQGRQVNFTSVSIKGMLQTESQATSPCFCRLIVVWDGATNGAAPLITDLLVASTSLSHNNLNNRARFKILLDEQYALGGLITTATQTYAESPTIYTINRYVKLPKCLQTNLGTSAAVTSIQSGAIWMFTIGNVASATGGTFTVATRCRFLDD